MSDRVGRGRSPEHLVAMHKRRREITRLRFYRHWSEQEIADHLGVNVATVSRDIHWIRTHWAKQYGVESKFSATDAIGESLAFYKHVEQEAMGTYAALRDMEIEAQRARNRRLQRVEEHTTPDDEPNEPLPVVGRQTYRMMRCLKVAQEARVRHDDLLMDLGLLDRHLGTLTLDAAKVTSQSAREFHRAVMSYVDGDVLSPAEQKLLGGRNGEGHGSNGKGSGPD